MTARDTQSASAMRGADVRAAGGRPLGKLEDVLFDIASGRVEYALIARGGPGKLLAVPRSRLRHDAGQLVVDADEDVLSAAPEFTRAELRQLADERVRADIDARFGRATPGL